jgi:hypothetical protein
MHAAPVLRPVLWNQSKREYEVYLLLGIVTSASLPRTFCRGRRAIQGPLRCSRERRRHTAPHLSQAPHGAIGCRYVPQAECGKGRSNRRFFEESETLLWLPCWADRGDQPKSSHMTGEIMDGAKCMSVFEHEDDGTSAAADGWRERCVRASATPTSADSKREPRNSQIDQTRNSTTTRQANRSRPGVLTKKPTGPGYPVPICGRYDVLGESLPTWRRGLGNPSLGVIPGDVAAFPFPGGYGWMGH